MKATLLSGILVATVFIVGGCGRSQETATPLQSGTHEGAETKTIATVETSKTDFPKLMNKWTQEGWLVLNTSSLVTNTDGTMHRTVTLAKRNP
jgi:hypothetical protein